MSLVNSREKEERKVLTQSEWYDLSWSLALNLDLFVRKYALHGDYRFLTFLLERTIRFQKFSDILKTDHFIHGVTSSPFRGTWLSRRSIFRIRDSLVARNLIEFIPVQTGLVRLGIYRLNIPCILDKILLQPMDADTEVLLAIRRKVVAFWGMAGYSMREAAMSTDMQSKIAKGLAKNLESAQRRKTKKKARSSDDATIWNLLDDMKQYCTEANITFHDTWGAREMGSARQWLNQCLKNNQDAKKILWDVCQFWSFFKRGSLFNDQGKEIVLPDTVSFSKFYIYRREICSWLAVHKDTISQQYPLTDMKVVDLRTKREERRLRG